MTVKQFIVCMCGLFVHSKHTWKKQNKKVRACIYVFKDFVMLFFSKNILPNHEKN